MNASAGGNLIPSTIDVKSVHSNVSQEVVVTTVDKLKIILGNHLHAIERKREWIAPAGLFTTLVVVFPTTSFREFYLKPETWEAIFLIATIFSFVWLVLSSVRAFKAEGIDSVIDKIKSGE